MYVILPWDLDFIPVLGRLDDAAIMLLAVAYWWKRYQDLKKRPVGGSGRGSGGASGRGPGGSAERDDQEDPYLVLGVRQDDGEEKIKKAYRDILGKYHPDRVQHLGEEFREMAARRTVAINKAFETIRKERNFS